MRSFNCKHRHDGNFKILGLFKSLPKNKNGRGPYMIIETIALVGFAFAAVTLGATAYERHMDVLHGPYIEGRAVARASIAAERLWQPLQSASEALQWKARNVVYLTSVIGC
jgi:hypothetical protein